MKIVTGRIKFSASETRELRKTLAEIFSNKRYITSPSSKLGSEQEFVLRCEALARKLYPSYKDAVIIKGSAAYACKLAGIRAKTVNVGGIAELALTKSREDARNLRIARAHGCVEPYKQRALGLNFMLDEVNAALVAALLKRELEKSAGKRA